MERIKLFYVKKKTMDFKNFILLLKDIQFISRIPFMVSILCMTSIYRLKFSMFFHRNALQWHHNMQTIGFLSPQNKMRNYATCFCYVETTTTKITKALHEMHQCIVSCYFKAFHEILLCTYICMFTRITFKILYLYTNMLGFQTIMY